MTAKISSSKWQKVLSLLPTYSDIYVGKGAECRRFAEGMLWVMGNGAYPAGIWEVDGMHKRFGHWCGKGIWERMHISFIDDRDRRHGLPGSTVVLAHA